MRRPIRGAINSATVLLVMASAPSAAAAPLWGYFLDVASGATDSSGPGTVDQNQIALSFDEIEPSGLAVSSFAAGTAGGFGSGSATATGANALLHALVSGQVGDQAGPSGLGIGGSGAGIVTTRYFDTFTIVSSSLAAGTPVTLNGELRVHGISSVTGAADTGCGPGLTPEIDDGFGNAFTNASANVTLGGVVIGSGQCTGASASFVVPVTIDTLVGSTLELAYTLGVAAAASLTYNDGAGGGSATYDASSTARLVLMPLASFDYVTASGNRFTDPIPPSPPPTAVPEPASLLLVGTGVLGLARRARHAHHSPRHQEARSCR